MMEILKGQIIARDTIYYNTYYYRPPLEHVFQDLYP